MQQLVELRERTAGLRALGVPLTIACLTLEGVEGREAPGVAARTGFDGPVMVDPGRAVKQAYDVFVGSVVVVDPQGVVRWVKPGARFKRPRAELVAHAFRALVLQDREPEAVAEARAQLEQGGTRARQRAAARLGELEALAARAALEQALLEDRARAVRVAAAEALALLRDPAAVVALSVAALDDDPAVRRAAAAALVGCGDDYQGYPGGEFRHEYTHAMPDALRAAGELVVAAAESLLARKDAESRRLGARLLFRLDDAGLVPRLVELSGDRDADVRGSALGGLFHFRERPEVRAAAEARRADRDERVRAMARAIVEGPVGKVRE